MANLRLADKNCYHFRPYFSYDMAYYNNFHTFAILPLKRAFFLEKMLVNTKSFS